MEKVTLGLEVEGRIRHPQEMMMRRRIFWGNFLNKASAVLKESRRSVMGDSLYDCNMRSSSYFLNNEIR
jgi:hypothetical protein